MQRKIVRFQVFFFSPLISAYNTEIPNQIMAGHFPSFTHYSDWTGPPFPSQLPAKCSLLCPCDNVFFLLPLLIMESDMNIFFLLELSLLFPFLFAREQKRRKKKSGSFSNRRKCDEIQIQSPSFLFSCFFQRIFNGGRFYNSLYEVVIKVSLSSD
jgi:hypothetical protein